MRDDYLLRYLYPFYAKDDAAGSGSDEGAEGDQGAGEGAEGDQGTPEGAGEGAEGESEHESEAAPKPDWRDKQLRKRNAQLAEAREKLSRAQEIEAENQRLKDLLEKATTAAGGAGAGSEAAAGSAAASTAKGLTEAEVDALAERKAAEKQFKRDTEAALAQGAKDYPKKDWEQAIENVKAAGGFDPEVLAQILGTDNPAKIIYELGRDPDRFEEVNNLSPHRRMAEFVKMTIPAAAPRKAVSKAADPVEPVGGRGVQAAKVNVYDPNITDEQYYEARQAQAAGDKRARARYARGLSGD